MPGFGSMLQGLGSAGNAYAQYANADTEQQMNKLKLQAALQELARANQTRQAMQAALPQVAQMQGQGPGGTVTPQQLAGMKGLTPEAFEQLNTQFKSPNQGMFNLQGRQISGDYGLQRADLQGQNALERTQTQQEGANQRAQEANQARKDIVGTQQTNANQRNKYSVDNRKASATNPANAASSPEYKTAKTEYDQAKQDERNIERGYASPAQAYNHPQWLDARKRSVAAQAKLEKITSAVAAKPANATPIQVKSDADWEKLPPGTQFIGPDGVPRTK
jgi:hypothetical protein